MARPKLLAVTTMDRNPPNSGVSISALMLVYCSMKRIWWLIASLASMLLVEVIALPAFIGLFNLVVDLPLLVLALALGTLGLAGVGTLFAAIAAHTRAREVLLPLLLFPIQVPVILATVKSTGAAIHVPGLDPPEIGQWLGLLIAFDALFLGLSVLLFDYAIEEE